MKEGSKTPNHALDLLVVGTDEDEDGDDDNDNDYDNDSMTMIRAGINGGWAEWSGWSRCSVSCGEGGIVSRTRTCTRPAPTFGGKNCQGSSTEYAPGIAPPCRELLFTVSSMSQATTHDESVSLRSSFTTSSFLLFFFFFPFIFFSSLFSPFSSFSPSFFSTSCTAIDGGWGSWVAWSKCSVTCGPGGESVRSRLCNEPVAEYGGKECVGKKDEKRSCAQKPCRECCCRCCCCCCSCCCCCCCCFCCFLCYSTVAYWCYYI